MNVHHTPLSTFCKYQLNHTNRRRDVPYLVMKPIDIHITLYKRLPITASSYPKNHNPNSNITQEIKISQV